MSLRNHTSQERRPSTSSTLPRISSFPRDAHLLPLSQQLQQQGQNESYMVRTHSTPNSCYDQDEIDEETIPVAPPPRNVHSYPVYLSQLGESEHSNPRPSKVPNAWQTTNPSKPKSKFHRVPAGLTMRTPRPDSDDRNCRDYVEEVSSLGKRPKRKVSPAGTEDNSHYLPALYSNAEHGSVPQKKIYGFLHR